MVCPRPVWSTARQPGLSTAAAVQASAAPSVTTASAGNTNVTTPKGDVIITTTTGDINTTKSTGDVNATKSTGDGNTTAGVAAATTTVAAANEMTTTAVPAATYIYKGSLKMTQKVFVPELLTTTSTQYTDMVNEVKPELEQLFKESTKYKGVSVKLTNFKFSAGSVVVDYTLTMDKPTTLTDLTVAVKEGVSKLNFTVDLASISFTGLDTSTLVAIVISAVLGTVFLILIILFVIFIMRRNLDWRSKGSRSTSDDDSGSLATHTMPHNNRLLMWMNAPLGIPVSGGQMTHHDMQRMRVIEQAASQAKHIDWSAMRNFANARRVLPNRNGQTPWGGQGFVSPPQPKQEEWGWSGREEPVRTTEAPPC
ncbi:hypothetical protein LSAT2_007274 [Lamellibrachia satsuma]|nr:hypothetical protein LSAT2_007274 [Lamellibrachia satsuma]